MKSSKVFHLKNLEGKLTNNNNRVEVSKEETLELILLSYPSPKTLTFPELFESRHFPTTSFNTSDNLIDML